MTAAEVSDTADEDLDGMSDLHEILAENDSDNSFMTAHLTVDIVGLNGNGAALQWVHVKDKTYSIMKGSSVGGTFTQLDSIKTLDTGKSDYTYTDNSATGGKAFYLIKQQ